MQGSVQDPRTQAFVSLHSSSDSQKCSVVWWTADTIEYKQVKNIKGERGQEKSSSSSQKRRLKRSQAFSFSLDYANNYDPSFTGLLQVKKKKDLRIIRIKLSMLAR